MSLFEEVIDANGLLQLSHQPQLPPGPVSVTIRISHSASPRRFLTDVIREIAAEQRTRDFAGRSASELRDDDDARHSEDSERDQELDAARLGSLPAGA